MIFKVFPSSLAFIAEWIRKDSKLGLKIIINKLGLSFAKPRSSYARKFGLLDCLQLDYSSVLTLFSLSGGEGWVKLYFVAQISLS